MAGFESAACRKDGIDPEVFFPLDEVGINPHNVVLIEQAKDVCRRCPVAAECLAAAFELDDPEFRVGIFGGMTGPERDQVVRAGRAATQARINAAKAAAHRARNPERVERGHDRCSTCETRQHVRVNGLIVKHPVSARHRGTMCPGSGRPPRRVAVAGS
jgi:WhiB family redox-sensing transcriptional regulator